MSEPFDAKLRLEQGTLVCRFVRPADMDQFPEVELRMGGEVIAKIYAEADASSGLVARFPIPVEALRDGAVILDVSFANASAHLGRYTMFNGAPPTEDLATTIELLRADLQALKRAFLEEAQVAKLSRAEGPLLIAEAVEQALAAVSGQSGSDGDDE